jgi:hypothetical protein
MVYREAVLLLLLCTVRFNRVGTLETCTDAARREPEPFNPTRRAATGDDDLNHETRTDRRYSSVALSEIPTAITIGRMDLRTSNFAGTQDSLLNTDYTNLLPKLKLKLDSMV